MLKGNIHLKLWLKLTYFWVNFSCRELIKYKKNVINQNNFSIIYFHLKPNLISLANLLSFN